MAAVSGKDVKIDPESHYDNWARKYENELCRFLKNKIHLNLSLYKFKYLNEIPKKKSGKKDYIKLENKLKNNFF